MNLGFEPRVDFKSHTFSTVLYLNRLYWLPISLIHLYIQLAFTEHSAVARQLVRSIFFFPQIYLVIRITGDSWQGHICACVCVCAHLLKISSGGSESVGLV